MTHSTAQIVSQMLEAHYIKSKDGYYGASPRGNAIKLMEGGLLQDYLNENTPQGLVKEFDSALTWATPTSCRDRLLILNCAAAADILPDDEPDHLSWRSIKTREEMVESVNLTKQPGLGFGFSLVTIDKNVYVRRLQAYSPAQTCGKVLEGDRVISICGRTVGSGFSQKDIIQLLKVEAEISVTLAHVSFDGRGCPETTLDRQSPLQSPALESSYKLALDLSNTSPGSGTSSLEEQRGSFFRQNGMSTTGCDSMLRGNIRADNQHTDNARKSEHKHVSAGSLGDTMSTSSLEAALTHSSSSGSDPTTRSSLSPTTRSSRSPRYEQDTGTRSSHSPRYYPASEQGPVKQSDRGSLTSSVSSHSSMNRDFYRDSIESIPLSVQSLGSTEYIVLPNKGKGIGIGISGKCGVIIRNILPGSIADKDGRLQIGDHILQVNNIKCSNMGQVDTKELIIPELRNSTPTVRLVVQHASNRLRKISLTGAAAHTPSKTGPGSTLPTQKHIDQAGDLLLPEAMWSDAHPSAPIAYRFGTVILPAPSWISWSTERHFVTLTRLANGYGFSIMDYKEPKQKSGDPSSVLIIRQITPFGAADLEGHLGLGERIVAVNKEPITSHTIEDIVAIIKPCSVLQLKMCKPVESDAWRSLLNTNISAIPLVSGPRSSRESSQEAISTSTLNVARATSYQSLVNSETSADTQSYTHQPIIRNQAHNNRQHGDITRHQGDTTRQHGDTTRQHGDTTRHHGDITRHQGDTTRQHGDTTRHQGDNILQEENFHRRDCSLSSNYSDSLCRNNDSIRRNGDLSRCREETQYFRDSNFSNFSNFCSRGSVSRYENTEEVGNRSRGDVNHNTPASRSTSNRTDYNSYKESVANDGSEKQQTTFTRRYQPSRKRDNHDAGNSDTLRRANSDNSDRMRRDHYEYEYDRMRHRDNRDMVRNRDSARQPRPPEPRERRVRSPDTRRQRYLKHGPVLSPQSYETTFGTRIAPKRSHSSGSNSEIQSIISSISGINNSELTELWKQRSKPSQLSKV